MIKNNSPNNSFEIRRLLNEKRTPILPFERKILHVELTHFGVEQEELGRLLGEAMEQSSETWHDNAPADAINHESRILSKRAEKIIADLGSAVLLDYPSFTDKHVTLGSIVDILYPRETEPESLLLTGMCRTIPVIKNEAPFPADLEVITVRSPLGEAIIEMEAGHTASYRANGNNLAVEIINVQQFDPQYLIED